MSSGRSAERWKYPWLSVCNERPRVHVTAWFSLAVGYLLQDRVRISELGRMLWRALCIGALSAGIASCDAVGFKNWSWNQRLVLEVRTPAGIVSDGSVVAIAAGASPRWLVGHDAAGMSGRVAGGEASFVEIVPGRYLFALLGNDTEQIPYYTFFSSDDKNRQRQAAALETMRAKGNVPRDRYPLLVTFDDLNDPKSVRRVDPADLAASFGLGVSLTRVTLEITGGPVTRGRITDVLPWLADIGGGMLDGSKISTLKAENRLANDLSRINFERK